MLDELGKALGPWPILQLVLGIAVLGAGIWAIVRGSRGEGEKDKRAEWAAYDQLRHIEENTFKLVALQEKMVDTINRLTSVLWNRGQEK